MTDSSRRNKCYFKDWASRSRANLIVCTDIPLLCIVIPVVQLTYVQTSNISFILTHKIRCREFTQLINDETKRANKELFGENKEYSDQYTPSFKLSLTPQDKRKYLAYIYD